MKRRGFLKVVGGLFGAAAVAPLVSLPVASAPVMEGVILTSQLHNANLWPGVKIWYGGPNYEGLTASPHEMVHGKRNG